MAEYKVNYTQSNFTGGIIAAELYGRNDFNKVKSGLKQCVNWTIREAGGLEFRRGTEYIDVIPSIAGDKIKTASIDDVFLVLSRGLFHYWWEDPDGNIISGQLNYPEPISYDVDNLQFVELQRRLYLFDGSDKLCEIKLDESHRPYAEVTKFESVPSLSLTPSVYPNPSEGKPDPYVGVKYQYAASIATDEQHESIAIESIEVEANAELGEGSKKTEDDVTTITQRIDLKISIPSNVMPSDKSGKVLLYRRYQGNFYYLDSVFLKEFTSQTDGSWAYTYMDKGQLSPDVSRAIKEKPDYLNSDGSITGVTSIADYGQRVFMTLAEYGTNIIFTQVGNFDSLAYSELRNEDEAGYLEVPVSHYDNWCKVVAGLDLIFSTSYTISQIQGYGDLRLQTVLFDGFSKTVQPVTTRRSMIYTNSNNRNIYDLTYNEYGQYDGIDLTLLVKYIFETKTIKRLAFKDYPVKTIYVLCDDGDLYCLTYIKDQNIYAWYQIKHEGKIHDLLVINRDTEDEIYLTVDTGDTHPLKYFAWEPTRGGEYDVYYTLGATARVGHDLYAFEDGEMKFVDKILTVSGDFIYPESDDTAMCARRESLDVEVPVKKYIIERAYHRTDNVYMDSVVLKKRADIVENKIIGLPDHMKGKKVRVFDLGNNRFYGEYDNANSKSITQGGVVVQIDDVDFNGYEVAEDGSIQLEDYIELEGNVLVGFPYYAVAETIPLEFSDQNGNSTIGRKKNITEGYLRYGDSRGLSYKTLGKEYDCKIPSKEISDTAEFLERGQMRLDVASEYKWDSTIKILQREPYPARIESITLGLHFNDKS